MKKNIIIRIPEMGKGPKEKDTQQESIWQSLTVRKRKINLNKIKTKIKSFKF